MKDNAEDIVRRATAAFNAGRADEARRLCEQGLARAPGDPLLSHLLAAVLFAGNDLQTARAHITASLAKRPDNAAAELLAARICRAGKDFDAALAHLDRIIVRAPQREAFLEKAREEYESFAAETGDDLESRAGVAAANYRIAQIQDRLGLTDEPATASLVFFPMHRVQRIEADSQNGELPSLAEQFFAKTGVNISKYFEEPQL